MSSEEEELPRYSLRLLPIRLRPGAYKETAVRKPKRKASKTKAIPQINENQLLIFSLQDYQIIPNSYYHPYDINNKLSEFRVSWKTQQNISILNPKYAEQSIQKIDLETIWQNIKITFTQPWEVTTRLDRLPTNLNTDISEIKSLSFSDIIIYLVNNDILITKYQADISKVIHLDQNQLIQAYLPSFRTKSITKIESETIEIQKPDYHLGTDSEIDYSSLERENSSSERDNSSSEINNTDSDTETDSIENIIVHNINMADQTAMGMLGKPSPFTGKDANALPEFLKSYDKWAAYRTFDDAAKLKTFPLLLLEGASRFYDELPANKKDTYAHLKEAIQERYKISEVNKINNISNLWQQKQKSGQSSLDFIDDVKFSAKILEVSEDEIKNIILKGLHPQIRSYVIQNNHEDIEQIQTSAKIAENSYFVDAGEPAMVSVLEKFGEELSKLSSVVANLSIRPRSKSPTTPKKVTFTEASRSRSASPNNRNDLNRFRSRSPSFQSSSQSANNYNSRDNREFSNRQSTGQSGNNYNSRDSRQLNNQRSRYNSGNNRQGWQSNDSQKPQCNRCGYYHFQSQRCPATGKSCNICSKQNHFASMCRTSRGRSNNQTTE